MSRKKHLLAGVMASALLVFFLSGLDITKDTPDETANVDGNTIVEDSGTSTTVNIDVEH